MDAEVLAIVADELPVAIWMGKVPSGEVAYTNREFRQVLGIEPPPGAARGAFVEPYGVHTLDGAPYPEDRMPFERAVAARQTVVVDDLVIHRRDGRHVHLRVVAKPIFDAAGEMTHVLEAFVDINREIEAEQARVEGERRLARAQRLESIGQLAAGIAHDFNNLLTVTTMVVSRLLPTEPDARRRDALAQVSAATDSAVALIRNLLQFAGRRRHLPVPQSLDAVAESVVSIARRTFDRDITIVTQLESADAAVLGDASQLEQVVMNLLLNARDAVTPPGEVAVRTRTEGEHVILEVSDTGCGIDPALRELIFEPYFTTKTRGAVRGTGLGLATVHGVVKGHGGTVEVVDRPGPGTTMRVTLPAARPTG
jgi:two-component system cell cycle sensor histidine kinase/response regulator CckA